MIEGTNAFRLHERVIIRQTDDDDDILEFVGLTGAIRYMYSSDIGTVYVVMVEGDSGFVVLLPCSADQLRHHSA